MEEIRLGTIGTGFIVRNILDNVAITDGIRLEAVYSRTTEAGTALAQHYHVSKVCTDLDAFLADEAVNCVYVASPNSLHYRHTKMALLAGKHVICEKPFAPKAAQARELVALAKEKGLMLVDATPTAYMPNLEILRQLLPRLGRIRIVMSNYSQYSSRYVPLIQGDVPNTFNPQFAGGCLMDLNYYNLYLNVLLFGKPHNAVYFPNLWENGIDTSGVLVMQYDGFVSTNTAAKDSTGENFFQIEGENGYIYIVGNNFMKQLRLVTKDGEETFNIQESSDVWFYEIQKVAKLLLQEDRQTLSQGLDVMVDTMQVLEAARLGAGIRFPVDDEV